ncbi:hypothetical protein V6N11_030667 [Hibiscus sabdariffa]|uniref:Uncharacterized protein n=1 Tax=Hibiscus sabdariffa TaxID=183260 RepID=A0ABR2NMJ1_9ROSI
MTLQFSSFTPVKIPAKHIHIVGWDRYDQKYSPKFPSKFPRTSLSNTHQVPNPISLQPPVNQVHPSYILSSNLTSLDITAVKPVFHALAMV